MLLKLENVLTGAWIRAVAGIRDMGEVVSVLIGDPDGEDTNRKDGANDVWTESQDASLHEPTGKITSRLFFPGNALFRLPRKGDRGIALHGADAKGPGKGMVMFGDANGQVPDGLDDNNAYLSLDKESLHVETRDAAADQFFKTENDRKIQFQSGNTTLEVFANGKIEAKVQGGGKITMNPNGTVTIDAAAGQNIVLNGGVLSVARQTDSVTGTAGPYSLSAVIAGGNARIKG